MTTFAQRLRALRKKRKMPLRELANMSVSYLSQAERGIGKPPDEDLMQFLLGQLAAPADSPRNDGSNAWSLKCRWLDLR